MYTLAVKRDFVAQHYLIGDDWGAENEWHSHHYQVELQLSGLTLDQHNYLVDIVDVETVFDTLVARFQDKTLNDLPEFQDTNPSIELFAKVLAEAFAQQIQANTLSQLRVQVWENEIAWAAYQLDLSS
ncbi:6-carboxytetrahydropterin synthase [Anaerolineales bacterium HSG25]|nr:6-carboxytetrahydropterin synthase [Anaerolineales bacterium HSG25]